MSLNTRKTKDLARGINKMSDKSYDDRNLNKTTAVHRKYIVMKKITQFSQNNIERENQIS